MEINLNNERRSVTNSKLIELIKEVLGDKTKGIAIAVNDTVVTRAEWENFVLKENDHVTIIKATQGG